MKRIVMSLGTLVFAAAIVVGGTGAFFSDTETSTGNVFTAGSVTLLLNNITHAGNNDDEVVGFTTTEDETGISFAFDDLKPLDTGTVSFQVLNGANPAYVCARVIDQGGADNTLVGPEEDLSDTLAEGELDQFLSFAFDGGVGTIADVDGQWTELVTSPLAANTPTNSSFDYCFGEFDGSSCVLGSGDYNLAQTDSLSADVEFYAVQTRNNDGFSCDSLNEEDSEEVVFFNGFETDVEGWFPFDGPLDRVTSGTNGVDSATDGNHAEVTDGAFTRWGGYSYVFPVDGYTTEVKVYLDMDEADGTDKRFDFSSAISDTVDSHRRDFIFHLGTNSGAPGQWAASVSNNAPGWPLNPARSPVDITSSGWYTLQAYFHDNGAGELVVTMNVLDDSDSIVGTWDLTDPSDVIGSTVGGNRYGWFLNIDADLSPLAFDDSVLYLGSPN